MTPERIRQIFKALETGDGAAFSPTSPTTSTRR
jgi:hypothetical protein